MSKIILISEYVKENSNSTGFIWSRIIFRLKKEGFDVKIISPKIKFKSRFINSFILSRVFFKFSNSFLMFLRVLLVINKNDIILAGTNPEFLIFFLAIIKYLKKNHIHLIVHDIFPENLIAAKILSSSSPLFTLLNYFYKLAIKKIDRLYIIGRDMKPFLLSKGLNPKKITLMTNWCDTKNITYKNKSESIILNKLNWDSYIVFQFFGNIGRVQGIKNLIAAIKLVNSPRAAFMFVGDGIFFEDVLTASKEISNCRIACFPSQPQNLKSKILRSCDVALISLSEGMKGLAVPSKAYFSLAAGKPLLAIMDINAEVALMIKDEKVGWVVSPNNPIELARAIEHICTLKLEEYSKRARLLALNKYSEEKVLSKLIYYIKKSFD